MLLRSSVVEIFTCSQKEHILHNASLCRYVICNDTSLVQHNLSDTEGGMEGVEEREEEGESGWRVFEMDIFPLQVLTSNF